MASILKYFNAQSTRYNSAKKRLRTEDNQAVVAATSAILYVGNLSFVTTEQQIYEVFRRCGAVKRIVMGLNRETKKPYYRRDSLVAAMNYLNGTKLDNRHIRLQVDKGFREGRQYGRGASGGQVRDELRADYDAGRGGHGVLAAQNAMLDRNRGEHKQNMAEFTADYTGRYQHEAEHGSGQGSHGGDKRGRSDGGWRGRGRGGRGRGRGRGRGGGGHRRHSGEHRGHYNGGGAGGEAIGRDGYKRSRDA